MSELIFAPLSVEDAMALSRSLHLDLPEERAVMITISRNRLSESSASKGKDSKSMAKHV